MPFEVAGMQVFVGASIGVVLAAEPDCRYTDLLRKADVALYKAKHEGRGCYRIFSDEMDERRRRRDRSMRSCARRSPPISAWTSTTSRSSPTRRVA